MNKIMRRAAPFTALAVLVLWTSCAGLAQSGEPSSFGFHDYTSAYPPGETVRGRVELTFHLAEVSGGPLQRLARKILYKGKSAAEYQRRLTKQWQNDYAQTARDIAAAEGAPYTADWSYEEDHHIISRERFTVLFKKVSFYSGGAHPNWYENAYVIDIEGPRQIGLGDLVPPENRAALHALADRELRRLSVSMTGRVLPPGRPLSEGGLYLEDSFPPLEDFYPADNGLNFQWDPYEIAPYAAGGIGITLTWKELTGLLSPLGQEMAEVFSHK